MGKVSTSAKFVSLKLVYFGAPRVGKSTNLERLRARAGSIGGDRTGDLIELDHDGDKTLMFDWMPIKGANSSSFDLRLQVYTVPGTPKHDTTKRRVLKDADGVVFVLDTGPDKLADNRSAWAELGEHLLSLGSARDKIPLVIQYNKRDLPNAMHIEDLRSRLGLAGFPMVEAVAKGSAGVGATLLEITKRALRTLSDPERGGESLDANEIARLDNVALPEAFAACSLLPKRMRQTPAPAEEMPTPVSHRSHDSPVPHRHHDSPPPPNRIPERSTETTANTAPTTPSGALRVKEKPTTKFAAAKLVASMPHEAANAPAAQFVADAPGSQRGQREVPSREEPQREPPSMNLKPMAPLGVVRETRGTREMPNKPVREPAREPGLPLVDARPASEVKTRGENEARLTLELPKIKAKDAASARVSEPTPTLEEIEGRDVRELILESEARMAARMNALEESIQDLNASLMHLVEQVRRVSTAPPESEARVIRMVRDALEQVEAAAQRK